MRELAGIKPGTLVAMSNSSDPYPPLEKDLRWSRLCLQCLGERGVRVQVVTKSDLVVRDADLLESMSAMVSMTVTTLDESLARRLEPGAPAPKKRLWAMGHLSGRKIPVAARIDPLIPGINDAEIEELVLAAAAAGARHITSSTYKARPDSQRRLRLAFPEEAQALKSLFAEGSRAAGSLYLPLGMRRELLERVRREAMRQGITFSCCREGLDEGTEPSCDGSHLVPDKSSNQFITNKGKLS